MKKLVNSQLIKNLIDTDFLFLESKNKKSSHLLNSLKSDTLFQNVLDPVELIPSLKQIIKLIVYIKKNNFKRLIVKVDNKQHYFLLKEYLMEHPTNFNIQIQNSFFKDNLCNEDKKIVLFLDRKHPKNSIERLFSKKILLNIKINSKIEQNNFNSYKLYNDLFDIKKIIFLITLLHKLLKN